jgi:hypothetical protein
MNERYLVTASGIGFLPSSELVYESLTAHQCKEVNSRPTNGFVLLLENQG